MYLHDLICHLVHHFTFNMPCFLCFSCINSKVYQEVSEVVWTLIYCSLNFPSVLGILSKFNCLIFFTSILLIWSWKKPQYLISFYNKYCILKCLSRQTNQVVLKPLYLKSSNGQPALCLCNVWKGWPYVNVKVSVSSIFNNGHFYLKVGLSPSEKIVLFASLKTL